MHIHYDTDSISVCTECGVTRRLVMRLNDSGLYRWGEVKVAYASGDLFDLIGIGKKSIVTLMEVPIKLSNTQKPTTQ